MIFRASIFLLLLLQAITSSQPRETNYNVFAFRFDNDFVFGTDRYFTNGFNFSLTSEFFEKNPLNKMLFPAYKQNKKYYKLELIQEIYTPREKESLTPVPNDRPFSANLYLAYSKKVFLLDNRSVITYRFLLGIMGKYAFGEEVQNGIHSLLPPSGEVLGWDNQLSSAPLLSYAIDYEYVLSKRSIMELRSEFCAELGQPDTRFSTGLIFNIGNADRESDVVANEKLYWQFSFRPIIRFVFFNANLQGGVFTHNIYSISSQNVERILFNLQNDFIIYYGKINFTLGYEMITKEFATGKAHLWFYTEFSYKF